jgi:hypothetical protein
MADRVIKPDSGNQLVLQDEGGSAALTVETDGDIKIDAGNVIIATSGKGIDFSANSHSSGMTSELLDFYEEGTWTPSESNFSGSISQAEGHYIKIGSFVCATGIVHYSDPGSDSNPVQINGLPFNPKSQTRDAMGGYVTWTTINFATTVFITSAGRIDLYKLDGSVVPYNDVKNNSIRFSVSYISA